MKRLETSAFRRKAFPKSLYIYDKGVFRWNGMNDENFDISF